MLKYKTEFLYFATIYTDNRSTDLNLKVKFTLEQAFNSRRNLGCRWGWLVNAMPWSLYPRERDPVPIYRRVVEHQGLV